MSNNIGRWESHYAGMSPDDYSPFGDTRTYGLAYNWLRECPLIEDWGGGKGHFATLCAPGQYLNVDGTPNPHVDILADLESYCSDVPGILLRHVLEHNYRWRVILANALDSFSDRMALVLFTPLGDATAEMAYDKSTQSPDLSFSLAELLEPITRAGIIYSADLDLPTATQYGIEHVLYLKKRG